MSEGEVRHEFQEREADGARSAEGERRQMQAHLRALVRDRGVEGAAEELGVSARTLRRSRTSGELAPKLEEALERHLTGRLAVGDAPWWRRLEEVERRLVSLEEAVRALAPDREHQPAPFEPLGMVAALRRDVESRLDAIEGRMEGQVRDARREMDAAAAPNKAGSDGGTSVNPAQKGVHPSAPEVVRLVEARNAAKRREETAADLLERASAAVQRLEAERALIEEHGETWPPGRTWSRSKRSEEMAWRWDALEVQRRELGRLRRRRWVRRLVTLGLSWW